MGCTGSKQAPPVAEKPESDVPKIAQPPEERSKQKPEGNQRPASQPRTAPVTPTNQQMVEREPTPSTSSSSSMQATTDATAVEPSICREEQDAAPAVSETALPPDPPSIQLVPSPEQASSPSNGELLDVATASVGESNDSSITAVDSITPLSDSLAISSVTDSLLPLSPATTDTMAPPMPPTPPTPAEEPVAESVAESPVASPVASPVEPAVVSTPESTTSSPRAPHSDGHLRPALKSSNSENIASPTGRSLRFQFLDHEFVTTPSAKHVLAVEPQSIPSPTIRIIDTAPRPGNYERVQGLFGGLEFGMVERNDLFRLGLSLAALRRTAKFSVFTHMELEADSQEDEEDEEDIDTTIVLDNAPPQLVRKASLRRISSFVCAKPGGVRFEVEPSDKPSNVRFEANRILSPPQSPAMHVVRFDAASASLSASQGDEREQGGEAEREEESDEPVLQSPPPFSRGVARGNSSSSTAVATTFPMPYPSPKKAAPSRLLMMKKARSERPHHIRQELVRMESGLLTDECAVCNEHKSKGLFCMADDHFICVDCFSPHVQHLCEDMRQLRHGQFSVYCPVPGCLAAQWNSYHVSKCLSGKALELYIDTLVQVCQDLQQEDSSTSTSTSAAASRISPTRTVSLSDNRNKLQGEILALKETMNILKTQLLHHGIRPIEYIPLAELNAELAEIFSLANRGQTFDEARLDYLLMCMDNNPEYISQQEAKALAWREEFTPFASTCLAIMRSFVPPHIFHSSYATLTEKEGMHPELAKRLLSRKCLWLVRLHPASIDKIHEVELMGRFNFEAQGLDVVELAAIYASLPEKFTCDPNGKKQQWRALLEQNLKKADSDARSRALAVSRNSKHRFAAYTKQEPMYGGLAELHEFKQA